MNFSALYFDDIHMDEEIKIAAQNYLYRNLKDSIELMYSGSVYDTDLQNFFTILSLKNIGELDSVDELLNNNDFANAFLQNGKINPDKLSEANSITVNNICTERELDFDDLYQNDSIAYSNLVDIAYQYPLIGGEAVYRARAILGIDIDDTQLAFRLVHTTSKLNPDDFLIIPNPTTGVFSLRYTLKDNEVGKVKIYDNLGKIILVSAIEPSNNYLNFDLSGIQAGVYYLKVTLLSGLEINKKIVLIK
jgi:hypothetical protein